MKKKLFWLFIIVILIILFIVFVLFHLSKDKDNNEDSMDWVSSYIPVIYDALNGESEEVYLSSDEMDNLKIEVIKSDDYEYPFVILEYTEIENDIEFHGYNIFYLKEGKVDYYTVSFSGDTTLVYLYDIQENKYGWYFYSNHDDLITLESLDNILKGDSVTEPFGSISQFEKEYKKIDDINSYYSISVDFNIDENKLKNDLNDLATKYEESYKNTVDLKEKN